METFGGPRFCGDDILFEDIFEGVDQGVAFVFGADRDAQAIVDARRFEIPHQDARRFQGEVERFGRRARSARDRASRRVPRLLRRLGLRGHRLRDGLGQGVRHRDGRPG